MSSNVNVRSAFSNSTALVKLLLASRNPRHAMAILGTDRIRRDGLSKDEVNTKAKTSARGFYSWLPQFGREGAGVAIEHLKAQGEIGQAVAAEIENVAQADQLFTGFPAVSVHDILGLRLTVYPGLPTIDRMDEIFPAQGSRSQLVRNLIERNMGIRSGQPSPIELPEDHPGWSSEMPDMRNIRGEMKASVEEAFSNAEAIARQVDQKYGTGTMDRITNIVVCGIGANDMYLKDLPQLVNADSNSKRRLYSIFEPSQLDKLPADVIVDNTLFIAISRGGDTQETVKTLEFANQQNRLKYLVGFVGYEKEPYQRGELILKECLLKKEVEKDNGIVLGLNPLIGGRYMWAKGLIVLVPFALAASRSAWAEYTTAMIEFDNRFWPVGSDDLPFQLAKHIYHHLGAYNIPGLFACSNHPALEAGLRQWFQLHNEAVGKVINGTLAYGAAMEMLPFAHAGADGLLGAAISAMIYGSFIFDSSYHHEQETALAESDLLAEEARHAGLTPGLLKMACVFPNWAKLVYSGAPNFMVTMDGVNYRNLATLTALYQSVMYTYLIMNGTNPDSNPNVAMVRKNTSGLLTALIGRGERSPLEVIMSEAPRLMGG